MRFHIVSLPHTQTTYAYEACAYTSKQRKLCNMLKSLGHTVYLYAGEENDAACDEKIMVVTKEQQRKWFGNQDFKKEFFNITWNPQDIHWVDMNSRVITAMGRRIKKGDFICVVGGVCQEQIAKAFPYNKTVESGIGYMGTFSKYRVFESYAWMHYIYGQDNDDNGHFNDAVIPNYFEPERFPFKDQKDDFYLFLGRFIPRKGIEIAVEATRAIGAKLVLAGQGVDRIEGNKIIGSDLTVQGDHLLHLGFANLEMRGQLLARAKAVFMPTTYLEPFGGVSIEALLAGTPVIATDFGAFPENIPDGKVGYRFRTFDEAVWAAKNAPKLNSKEIRKYAVKNFSVNRVKNLYQAYFEQLSKLDESNFFIQNNQDLSRYKRYRRM